MSGHAVLAVWTPSVSRDSMPVQHARTEWPLFADNHIYDEKKCPYSKIDNKNNIYIQERTKWTDILRVHIERPFSVLPYMIERKKKSNLSVLDFKTRKNASSCSLFQVNTSPKGIPKARCFYSTLCEGNIPSSPSRSFTGSSLSIEGTRYRAFFLPVAHTDCGRVGRSITNRGPEFKRNYGLSPRCHGRALPA